jgi:hypothetical protein
VVAERSPVTDEQEGEVDSFESLRRAQREQLDEMRGLTDEFRKAIEYNLTWGQTGQALYEALRVVLHERAEEGDPFATAMLDRLSADPWWGQLPE